MGGRAVGLTIAGQWTSQLGQINRWSACYSLQSDEQGDAGELLCQEEEGTFAVTQELCPAPVQDDCARVTCGDTPTCAAGQQLSTTPPEAGECCGTATCVDVAPGTSLV